MTWSREDGVEVGGNGKAECNGRYKFSNSEISGVEIDSNEVEDNKVGKKY